jgi:hypothetical protein
MAAQLELSIDNLETVLKASGYPLLGVASLAFPELKVEIEATAVK